MVPLCNALYLNVEFSIIGQYCIMPKRYSILYKCTYCTYYVCNEVYPNIHYRIITKCTVQYAMYEVILDGPHHEKYSNISTCTVLCPNVRYMCHLHLQICVIMTKACLIVQYSH